MARTFVGTVHALSLAKSTKQDDATTTTIYIYILHNIYSEYIYIYTRTSFARVNTTVPSMLDS